MLGLAIFTQGPWIALGFCVFVLEFAALNLFADWHNVFGTISVLYLHNYGQVVNCLF